MPTDFWQLARVAPDAYTDWKAAVANGDTLTGFLLWVAQNRPDELAKVKQ